MNRQSGAWQRGIFRWRYFVAALCVILLAFSLVMRGIRQDRAAVMRSNEAANQLLTQQRNRYDALSAQLDAIGTKGYIENSARQNYSFVWDGEKLFEITNPEKLDNYTYEEMQILLQERKGQ